MEYILKKNTTLPPLRTPNQEAKLIFAPQILKLRKSLKFTRQHCHCACLANENDIGDLAAGLTIQGRGEASADLHGDALDPPIEIVQGNLQGQDLFVRESKQEASPQDQTYGEGRVQSPPIQNAQSFAVYDSTEL